MELKFGRFDASDDLSVQLERAEKVAPTLPGAHIPP